MEISTPYLPPLQMLSNSSLFITETCPQRIYLTNFSEAPPLRARTLEGHERSLTQIVYGGDVLASASRDKTVRLWSLSGSAAQQPLSVYQGHDMAVMGLALSNGEIFL